MKYNFDVFRYQFQLVLNFAEHLAYYRYLRANTEPTNFWCRTSDAHLETAISNWCKVFGSERTKLTHWKNTATENTNVAKKRFREILEQDAVMNSKEWTAFKKTYELNLEEDKWV